MAIRTLDVAAIRKDFPIFETGIAYLDSANTSQRPRQVTGAMLEYFEKFNSNIHRAAYRIAEEATVRYEATREKVRAFINAASTREIVYTRGTTEAINLVAYSWGRKNIKAGDLIVLTILDHHSNIVPWQILAASHGAQIEYVDIDDRGELRLDQFADLLRQGPKLVAFNLVSNALGTINPAREMVAAAKKAGATVLLDGAQSTPHQPVDVRGLDCDFYAFSGHKMLGPTGAGILYGRRLVRARRHPSARPGHDRGPRPGLPPRRPPLRDAADDAAWRSGDRARLLLRLHAEGRDRPARELDQRGAEDLRVSRPMSADDQFYREYILDHYKNPRN